jgi:hypothetical protein
MRVREGETLSTLAPVIESGDESGDEPISVTPD